MNGFATAMMGSLVLIVIGCSRNIERSKYEESQAELVQIKQQLEEARKKTTSFRGPKRSTLLPVRRMSLRCENVRKGGSRWPGTTRVLHRLTIPFSRKATQL